MKTAKINTNNKSYSIEDSVFYKLSSKQKLAKYLCVDLSILKQLDNDANYHQFVITKNNKTRDVQEPKELLDNVHTRVASLLCRITPPPYLYSGVKKRTHISNAQAHSSNDIVITMDIKSFFPSTSREHVFSFFYKVMLCSPDVADILSKILTFNNHIPTGSRVSMPLAYYANQKMFLEMLAFAKSRDLIMTIYVDDLTFSGNKFHNDFVEVISKIANKYQHKIHPDKTKVYFQHAVKVITGVAIKDGQLIPKQIHQKNLHDDLQIWISQTTVRSDVLYNRILGRMSFLGLIEPKFKDRARTFRETAYHIN